MHQCASRVPRPRSVHPLVLALLLFAVPLAPLAAQGVGSVDGRVVDSTGNALPGARVEVDGRSNATASGRDGRYFLGALPPGVATLRARYIGFQPATVTVAITAGGTTHADLVLRPAVQSLSEIATRAARPRGEVQALTQQQNAQNIVNVLPSEVITSLPNTNIADAVGRIAGVTLERDEGEGKYVQIRGTEPRLTNLTINGVRVPNPEAGVRNAKLDVIPSDIVGAIEVHKTLQADMDGDAIGGSVNLVTRTADDRPFFMASGYGGYTDILHGRAVYQGSLALGQRFGASKRFGVVLGGSYDWNGRGIDDIEVSPGSGTFGGQTLPVPAAGGLDQREYVYQRERLAFAGGLDYRLGAGSTLFLKGLFSNFWNYGTRYAATLIPGGFNQSPTLSDTSGQIERQYQTRRPNEQVYSLLAGGTHDLGGPRLEYGVAVSRAQQIITNAENAFWITDAGANPFAWTADATSGNLPRLTVANGASPDDASSYAFEQYRLTSSRTFHRELSGKVDLTVPYGGHNAGAFKVGGQVRDALKTNVQDLRFFNPAGAGGPALSQVLSSFTNAHYYFHQYDLGPAPDPAAFGRYFAVNPSQFALDGPTSISESDQGGYRTKERVYAGYAMLTQEVGALDLQAGVRIERTQADYVGNSVLFDVAGNYVATTPTPGSQRYTNVLPSASLKYAVDPRTNVRAAFGVGIARPNFSDLPPFLIENDQRQQLSAGNPALKPTRANDVDVEVEHFFASVGVLSAAFFYKDLHDYIAPQVSTVASGPNAGFELVQPVNVPRSHVLGAEFSWQQHLSFLPGALNGLGILANYTFNDSKATVQGRTDDPRLLRTAPAQWNLGLTYDKGGFSARVAATHNGASIYEYNFQDGADLGPRGPNGDVYLYARTQVDAQVSYLVHGGVQLFGNALNLTNEVFGFYNGDPKYPIQREFYGVTISAGARYTY